MAGGLSILRCHGGGNARRSPSPRVSRSNGPPFDRASPSYRHFDLTHGGWPAHSPLFSSLGWHVCCSEQTWSSRRDAGGGVSALPQREKCHRINTPCALISRRCDEPRLPRHNSAVVFSQTPSRGNQEPDPLSWPSQRAPRPTRTIVSPQRASGRMPRKRTSPRHDIITPHKWWCRAEARHARLEMCHCDQQRAGARRSEQFSAQDVRLNPVPFAAISDFAHKSCRCARSARTLHKVETSIPRGFRGIPNNRIG
jgi:hypothetical protein